MTMFKSLSPRTLGVEVNLEAGLALAAEAGFEGLDVNIQEVQRLVQERGAAWLSELFEGAGLRIGAWGLSIPWDGPEESFRKGLEVLPSLVAAGAAVGATRITLVVRPGSDERAFEANFNWHIDRIRPVAEILDDEGCRLGLEFLGPRTLRTAKAFGFIHTSAGMLALADAIGTGNVGLLLDSWHWYTSQGTISDLSSLAVREVVHVHVNDAPAGVDVAEQIDNKRALPTETGVIDLVGFLMALKEMGYDGPVTPEPFSERVREMEPAQAVQSAHDGLDEAWRSAGLR